jgi:transcriptional regulator with XRE-family HTH domain
LVIGDLQVRHPDAITEEVMVTMIVPDYQVGVNAIDLGMQLRRWRNHRRLSQLDLALDAGVSARHLSFVETGRARPSRELVLALARHLRMPLRERNRMLLAAGFAPCFAEHGLDDERLAAGRAAIGQVLAAYQPNPALAVDAHWDLVEANGAALALLADVAPGLLVPPVNVLRLSLHPLGLAPRILNLPQWRSLIFQRLDEEVEATADPALVALLDELRAMPGGEAKVGPAESFVLPLRLASPAGELSFISMTTVFGTPLEVTLSEVAIEAFLPADTATAERIRTLGRVPDPAS